MSAQFISFTIYLTRKKRLHFRSSSKLKLVYFKPLAHSVQPMTMTFAKFYYLLQTCKIDRDWDWKHSILDRFSVEIEVEVEHFFGTQSRDRIMMAQKSIISRF